MIYIFTALYCEAQPFIEQYHLTKDVTSTHFQVFVNEAQEICLTITGVGNVAAAAAVAGICTKGQAGNGDWLINCGICAQQKISPQVSSQAVGQTAEQGFDAAVGRLYLCNKIVEQTTGRTFYPDILYRHEFAEAQLVTRAKAFDGEAVRAAAVPVLYDMEAAAVYQAGAYFVGPHQMTFLKVVSDNGTSEKVCVGTVRKLIEKQMPAIAAYIARLQDISKAEQLRSSTGGCMSAADLQFLEKLCADLHCSETMRLSLTQYLKYCVLSGITYQTAAEELYQNGKLPCRDRKEGKKCLEELKQRLL